MNIKSKKGLSFILLLSMIGFTLSFSKVPDGHNCGSEAYKRICYQADLTNPNSKYCKPVTGKTWCFKAFDIKDPIKLRN